MADEAGLNIGVFNGRAAELSSLMKRLAEIADFLRQSDAAASLREDVRTLAEENFSIAVVGEFSAGKSTLINALLGADVLPSSDSPTTAILNRIGFAEAPSYTIHYRNPPPAVRDITLEEFRSMVAPDLPRDQSEEERLRYAQAKSIHAGIKFASIRYPTPACPKGVEIIDTPGTNDLDDQRVEITYGLLPTVDAVIFVLRADQVYNSSESAFLRDRIIEEDIQRIFFVINKIDVDGYLQAHEKLVAHAVKMLKQDAGIESPKLFAVSARRALADRLGKAVGDGLENEYPVAKFGFLEFERNLAEFLVSDRGNARLEKRAARGISLANEILGRVIPLEKSGLKASEQEISSAISVLAAEQQRTRDLSVQLLGEVSASLLSRGSELSRTLAKSLREISNAAITGLDAYQGPIEETEIRTHLESLVAPMQTKFQQDFKKEQMEFLRHTLEEAIVRLNSAWAQTVGKTFEAIGSGQEVGLSVPRLDPVDGDASAGAALQFGAAFAAAWALGLPVAIVAYLGFGKYLEDFMAALARPKIMDRLKSQVQRHHSESLPKQIKIFEEEWAKKGEAIQHSIKRQVDSRFSALHAQLSGLLDSQREARQSADGRLEQLDSLQSELGNIRDSLNAAFLKMRV